MKSKEEMNSSTNDKIPKVQKAITPLPKGQIFCACLVEVCEGININVLFPFLAFMVEDLGHGGSELGYYAGGLAGSFCAAQFCSSIVWGWFSDRYGRKPAILLGTIGTAIGMLVFGTAKTYAQAVVGRALSGFLCGNLGVVKSFLTEVTDDTNRAKGFSLFSLGWAIGTVVAPILGGFLCKPADKYPRYFSQEGLFGYFPYLLPCLLCFCFNLLATVMSALVMVETRKPKATHSPPKQVEMTSLRTEPRRASESTQQFTILASEEDDEEFGVLEDGFSDGITQETTECPPLPTLIKNDNNSVVSSGTGVHRTSHGKYTQLKVQGAEEDGDVTDDELSSVRSGVGSPLHGHGHSSDVEKGLTATTGFSGLADENEGGGASDDQGEDDVLCCENGLRGWFGCGSRAVSSSTVDQDSVKLSRNSNVLRQRTVVLVTVNYGVLAMAYILLEETIPLFLKLDAAQGGFSFNSIQIGMLLSISGAVMFVFTLFLLPTVAKNSKAWLMWFGSSCAIPFAFAWPLLATINYTILAPLHNHMLQMTILWPALLFVCVTKSILCCLSATAVMLQVNHAVYDEHLGAVNGLGQSLASLSRAVGPAFGGMLWSLSIQNRFVWLNFIGVAAILCVNIYINSLLPLSLDVKKGEKKGVGVGGEEQQCTEMMH